MEVPRNIPDSEREVNPERGEGDNAESRETPENPEIRFDATERGVEREISDLVDATNRETSRLAFGDFAKFVDGLSGKPEVSDELRGLMETYAAMGDDELETEATRGARDRASSYLEGKV